MICDDLVSYLESRNIGTKGIDLFLNIQPDVPDNCVVVYDEPAPALEESSCLSIDSCGIQIIVRNSDDVEAKNKIKSIHKILTGFGGKSLISGGDIVSYIIVETTPCSIGIDKKNRPEWTAHYIARVESISGDENRL